MGNRSRFHRLKRLARGGITAKLSGDWQFLPFPSTLLKQEQLDLAEPIFREMFRLMSSQTFSFPLFFLLLGTNSACFSTILNLLLRQTALFRPGP